MASASRECQALWGLKTGGLFPHLFLSVTRSHVALIITGPSGLGDPTMGQLLTMKIPLTLGGP